MQPSAGGLISALAGFLVLAVGLLMFIFWVWMLIDAIRNPRLNSTEKLIWVLVIIFVSLLGALIYFFVGRGRSSA